MSRARERGRGWPRPGVEQTARSGASWISSPRPSDSAPRSSVRRALTLNWWSAPVWQPSTLAAFSAGEYGAFAEGMAADSHGRLFVSLTTWGYYDETVDPSLWGSNIGEVWRVMPNGAKALVATQDLSPNGMLLGVAVDRLDRVYVLTYD